MSIMENSKKDSIPEFTDREKPDFEEPEVTKKKKPSLIAIWSTRRKTLQSYITITLGLGHMLQFAAAIALYGGIMWIPYFVWAILVGVPLITVEIALSHYVNRDMKFLWEMCPIGKGVFYNCFIATFVATVFSNVYLTHLVHLSIDYHSPSSTTTALDKNSIAGCYKIVPVQSPGDENNTYTTDGKKHCQHGFFSSRCSQNERGTDFRVYVTDEHEWFPFLYLGLITFVILGISCMGVRSLEKIGDFQGWRIFRAKMILDSRRFISTSAPALLVISVLFTTFLVLVTYLCAVIFLILTLTLPRSVKYIGKSFNLNWSKLQEFSVWMWSFQHVINGFAIGTLCFTFVSLHSDFHDDIMIDVVIVFLTDFLSTLLFSCIVLGLLGTRTYEAVIETEVLPVNDYLAILVCTIRGLANLPPPKGFWSFLFFAYLTVSAIGSQSFMVASVADAVMTMIKKFRANTFLVTAGLCFIFFMMGSIILFLQIERLPFLDASFLTIGLLQCITLFWIYNYQKVCADFHFLMGYKPSLFYQFTWVISPLIFATVIIITIGTQGQLDLIENNALILGTLHFLIYFICGLSEAYSRWRKGENYNVFKNNDSWGPLDPLLQKSRIIFKSGIITKEHIYRQKLYKKQLVKPFDITDQNIVQLQ